VGDEKEKNERGRGRAGIAMQNYGFSREDER
jgi:hypothetical protein